MRRAPTSRSSVRASTCSTSPTSRRPDWCAGSPAGDNTLVATPGGRGNGEDVDTFGCGLYATAPVDVPAGKELTSVTLPSSTRMHVFAIATDRTDR